MLWRAPRFQGVAGWMHCTRGTDRNKQRQIFEKLTNLTCLTQDGNADSKYQAVLSAKFMQTNAGLPSLALEHPLTVKHLMHNLKLHCMPTQIELMLSVAPCWHMGLNLHGQGESTWGEVAQLQSLQGVLQPQTYSTTCMSFSRDELPQRAFPSWIVLRQTVHRGGHIG